jgi:hypothetical protein
MNTQIEETAKEPALALSSTEIAALLECESIIRKEQAAFVRVGRALARIRDGKLYRTKYQTFEEYCEGEWDMSDRYGRALRTAADVVFLLEQNEFTLLPATESQARPLSKLPREEWAPAWRDAIDTAPNGKVTAQHVVGVVQRWMNRRAGIDSDTEIVTKAPSQTPALSLVHIPRVSVAPVLPEKIIDVDVVSSRKQQIRAIAREAQAKLIELANAIGTPGNATAANVTVWIQDLDELQAHMGRIESRKIEQKETEAHDTSV